MIGFTYRYCKIKIEGYFNVKAFNVCFVTIKEKQVSCIIAKNKRLLDIAYYIKGNNKRA